MAEDEKTEPDPEGEHNVGAGEGPDGNAVSIPVEALERVASSMGDHTKNMTEAIRDFAREFGVLLDQDTATALATEERAIEKELADLRKEHVDYVEYVRVLQENVDLKDDLGRLGATKSSTE